MDPNADPLSLADERFSQFVAELSDLIRIPSIGSDPRHAQDMTRCARWLATHLGRLGIPDVRLLHTPGHPLVFAATRPIPGRPVVLIYGHYDVQPPGPAEAWRTPPFQPQVRGAWLFGRGASDDKGQLFAHVKAIDCWLRAGGPPIGVKLLLEGEEEVGSPNLGPALARHRSLLHADVSLVSDSPMLARGRPTITTGLRGSVGLEIEVRSSENDLHAGIFGGAVPDPIQVLCAVVAELRDASGGVATPGFYDAVCEPSLEERQALAAAGPSNGQLLADARAPAGWGDPSFTLFEKTTIRPALTVTGIQGGHTEPGDRSVLASRARARLNIRLVPAQQPEIVSRLLERHLRRLIPPYVRATLRFDRSTRPYRIGREHRFVRAAIRACTKSFGTRPALLPMGGSIGAVPMFQEVLGIPSVLVGFGLPDDGKHGPNERFHLPTFRRAIATSIRFLAEVA